MTASANVPHSVITEFLREQDSISVRVPSESFVEYSP